VGGFAEAEVDWLMKIGGITIETGKALGPDLTLAVCARSSTRCSSAWVCRA
jgi:hypothetical protein